jgi:hypothetical protein
MAGVLAGVAGLLLALPGPAGWQRAGQFDLVVAGGGIQQGDGGVPAVHQVLGGQQPAPLQPGVDARQRDAVPAGDDGGHVGDHVHRAGAGVAGLGDVREIAHPAGIPAQHEPGVQVIR